MWIPFFPKIFLSIESFFPKESFTHRYSSILFTDELQRVKNWCRSEIQKRMENRLTTVAFGDDLLDSTFLLELCKLASSKSYQVEIVLPQKGV